MLMNVRNTLIAAIVVVVHGGVVFAMATGQEPIQPPQVVPIALLGTLVTMPVEETPSDGVATPVEAAVTPVEPPKPEPPKPEPPKPEPPKPVPPKPEPVRPRPRPEPVPPKPEPEKPRPVPEAVRPEPSPVQPAETVAEPAQQNTSASPALQTESGTSSTPATQGIQSGDQDAVVAPSFNAAYLRNPKPPYPDMSRRLQEEGRVLLRVLISAEGKAKQVELKQSSGYKRLDDSALTTVRRWRFVPAKRGGQPVEMWYDVPVSFSLRS